MAVKNRCFLICIGNELTKGEILNSNVSFLGRFLFERGWVLVGERTVPDDPSEIISSLEEALTRADWVITTGGLGPTFDDITRDVLSRFLRAPLEFSSKDYSRFLKKRVKSVGVYQKNALRRQFYFPKKSLVLNNPLGSAFGFVYPNQQKFIVSLPGVPREFQTMISKELYPKFLKKNVPNVVSKKVVCKACGISEVEFLKQLGKLPFKNDIDYGIYPEEGEVRFTAVAKKRGKAILALKKRLLNRLGKHIYSFEPEESLSEAVGNLLLRKKQTISFAESCTGGLISSLITQNSGASNYFKGSIVTYSNEVKENQLNIPRRLIARGGAVSKEVAGQLAKQIQKKMGSTYGVSVTGIAGPRGGTKNKPVGTVYFGVSNSKGTRTQKKNFTGNRKRIQMLTSKWALFLLWQKIKFGRF